MHQKKEVNVDFGIERQYVFDILTSDISVADCILDLIDNSIDAARRDIGLREGAFGLPTSYAAYEIAVRMSNDQIEIVDNCQGMEEHLLASKAFRLGARHAQQFSIGIYGVGLIRAFWKLGNEGALLTDTGSAAYKLSFSKKAIQTEDRPVIPATVHATSKSKLNHLIISSLTMDAKVDVGDTEWVQYFKDKVRRVFGLCIRKGLSITVNGDAIAEFGPKIRTEIEDLSNRRSLLTTDGVNVEIKVGVHENYRFTGEPGHSAVKNGDITREFGWYVVCNDRIVLIADLSPKVGWSRVWHSEYNGFIGWVHFISDDAKLLPWDSSKTDISLEKRSQREVAPCLQEFAEWYRKTNRNYRYPGLPSFEDPAKGGAANGGKEADHSGGESNKVAAQSSKTKRSRRQPDGGDHNENWKTLFPDVEACVPDSKLKALVVEACSLPVEHPYAAMMLFRVIVERALNVHIKTLGKYAAAKQFAFDEAEKAGKPIKDENKRTFAPGLSQLASWMAANTEIFPEDNVREYIDALRNFRTHLKDINKIVHEGGLTNSSKVRNLRDDTWPLVRYLVETNLKGGNL
ncbi:MAG: ATP-binding protein [Alphaproteobacteria bacterium]|nr:ATP-binding protein [Alphaproteobacteria bacterium]